MALLTRSRGGGRRSIRSEVPVLKIAALALLVFVVAPARAQSQGGFATPPPPVLDQLKRQHHRKDWLRVTTDSTRWELRARQIDDAGLSGIKARDSAFPAPDRIAWSSISRIDVKDSWRRYGQTTGLVLGGLGGIAGGGAGMALGALAGMWVGGTVGGMVPSEHPLYIAPPIAPAASSPVATSEIPSPAAAPDSARSSAASDSARSSAASESASATATPARVAATARPSATEERTVWLVSQAAYSLPVRSFRPAGADHALGYESQFSVVPAHAPIGVRFDAGAVSYSGHQDGVTANILGSTQALDISLGTDLYWLMAGPQWGLKPRKSGGYLFLMFGLVHVRPYGQARWASTLIYEMEGRPASSTGFASSVGGGARLLLGKSKGLALTTEVSYQRRGDTEYIAEPGVDAGYSNPQFAGRRDGIQTVMVHVGLARQWGKR